ncbi:hypothetical protein EJB05_22884, partial [Eragrostis curvula]
MKKLQSLLLMEASAEMVRCIGALVELRTFRISNMTQLTRLGIANTKWLPLSRSTKNGGIVSYLPELWPCSTENGGDSTEEATTLAQSRYASMRGVSG